MLNPTPYLVIALGSSLLVACGGGGGGGAAAPIVSPVQTIPAVSLALPTLAKYEGVWRQDCVAHVRFSTTLTAINDNTFTVTPKEEHFANADCTGSVVATGSFGGPQETVQYATAVPNTSVKMLNGDLISADVNPATSTLAVANYSYTGSGVNTFNIVNADQTTTTLTYIQYPDLTTSPITARAVNGGTTQGGLLLRNDELLALVLMPSSTTDYLVNRRYVR